MTSQDHLDSIRENLDAISVQDDFEDISNDLRRIDDLIKLLVE